MVILNLFLGRVKATRIAYIDLTSANESLKHISSFGLLWELLQQLFFSKDAICRLITSGIAHPMFLRLVLLEIVH
ncbi:hypothetical protein Cal7507_1632 [Calothrix sp. PCC 7507]|nr:hypothetical protein Cal7507_1632 [Calothrix sp. PCC 7507]